MKLARWQLALFTTLVLVGLFSVPLGYWLVGGGAAALGSTDPFTASAYAGGLLLAGWAVGRLVWRTVSGVRT